MDRGVPRPDVDVALSGMLEQSAWTLLGLVWVAVCAFLWSSVLTGAHADQLQLGVATRSLLVICGFPSFLAASLWRWVSLCSWNVLACDFYLMDG